MRDSRLMVAAVVAALSVACGGGSQPAAPASAPAPAAAPAGKKPAPEPAASAEPPSAAEHGGVPKDPNERPETPHGGTMVALPDKSAQLEVVFDPTSGRIAIYSYGPDGHTPMKLKVAGIQVSVTPDGASAPVMGTLGPVDDPAAGNKPGDSAHFDATLVRLKGVSKFRAVVRGLPAGDVGFSFPM